MGVEGSSHRCLPHRPYL